MSRIGRQPVAVPAGVEVKIAENNFVTVKGAKGTLEKALPTEMSIKLEDGQVVVTRPNDLKKMKSLHGLTRTLIQNMVIGVSQGYEKTLEVNGVGYKAAKQGKKLVLSLGYLRHFGYRGNLGSLGIGFIACTVARHLAHQHECADGKHRCQKKQYHSPYLGLHTLTSFFAYYYSISDLSCKIGYISSFDRKNYICQMR